MKILNLGSQNIDRVYSVDHFVRAGETIKSGGFELFCGGKGLNQSVALARAGAKVWHAGAVGPDGGSLTDLLRGAGADVSLVQRLGTVSGHTVIQVTPEGQNCIIVCPGANGCMDRAYLDRIVSGFGPGDLLLLQNEMNETAYAMEAADRRGMKIAFNASPVTGEMLQLPLGLVDLFLVNEIEGRAIAGSEKADYPSILAALGKKYPAAEIVLTVGGDGVLYRGGGKTLSHGIYRVPVVDTTAAGDTFTGYFLASQAKGLSAAEALRVASLAAALAVGRKGAAPSIPFWDDVIRFGEERKKAGEP